MKQRKNKDQKSLENILVDLDGLCKILEVGQNQAREIAVLAEARVSLPCSKTARYSVSKIESYISQNTY